MLSSILESITTWGLHIISLGGYWGIFSISLLENVFTPIPSEAIIPFAGILVSQGKFSFTLVVVAATLGSLIGAYVFYYVGYILGADHIKQFIIKWGKYFFLSEDDVKRAEEWFSKYGMWAVLICRVIPLVRSFISIPAGYVKLPFWKFSVLTAIGSGLWSTFLVYIGFALGENYHIIEPYISTIEKVVAIILAIGFGYYLFLKMSAARKSVM
ncbi:DedA family protein [candidate division WWE3 bacterium]|nr:DedA family protein [candidate division WWE3 bacterium]